MIIDNSKLLATTAITRLHNHLRHGAENDNVSLLMGSWRGLAVTVTNAKDDGHKYSFMHTVLAPKIKTTREEALSTAVPLFCKEFKINLKHCTLVEHEKGRVNDPDACRLHWHLLVPWHDPDTNRAHNFSFDYPRQSKVAQLIAYRLGHPFVLTRHHAAIIAALRADGEHECADALESAFPPDAHPDNKSVPLGVVQAEADKGRDMVQLRSIVRMAERSTNTADELKDELKKHALFIAVGKQSPPVWVVIDAEGEVVGKLAGMAHCSIAKIIQRLGKAKHEYPIENGSADQRGQAADHVGEPVQLSLLDAAGAGSVDRAGSGPLAVNDGAFAEVFVAALAAPENELRLTALCNRALNLAAGALVQALQLWARIEAETTAYLIKVGGMVLPPTIIISNARRFLMLAEAKQERGEDRWRKAEGDLAEMRMAPLPPKVGLAAHQKRIRKQERYRDRCADFAKKAKVEANHIREQHQQFERHFDKQQAEYQQEVVMPKKKYAERILAVIARCRALVTAHPETLAYGGLALFRYGCAEAEKAPPNAKWHLDGPDDDESDHTPPGGYTLH